MLSTWTRVKFRHLVKGLRKKLWENIVEKGEIAHLSNFNFFHNVIYGICILKSFNSHISQLLSAASLNFGQSQNGVLGDRLIGHL